MQRVDGYDDRQRAVFKAGCNWQKTLDAEMMEKLAEALREAISQLNEWCEQETGEGFNNPEWNALLAEFDKGRAG